VNAAIIMTSTGIERKTSTTTVHTQRTGATRDIRPMPKTRPKMPARTTEMPAALRVLARPGSR
jgi:hypothetical protein